VDRRGDDGGDPWCPLSFPSTVQGFVLGREAHSRREDAGAAERAPALCSPSALRLLASAAPMSVSARSRASMRRDMSTTPSTGGGRLSAYSGLQLDSQAPLSKAGVTTEPAPTVVRAVKPPNSQSPPHRQVSVAGIDWPSCRRNAEGPGRVAAGPFASTRVFVAASAEGSAPLWVRTIRRRSLLVRAVSMSMSARLLAHAGDGDSIRLAPARDGGRCTEFGTSALRCSRCLSPKFRRLHLDEPAVGVYPEVPVKELRHGLVGVFPRLLSI